LANNKISDTLLYEPPETKKTLLARALAKQCNTTMLEVSSVDIFSTYVGESEKIGKPSTEPW